MGDTEHEELPTVRVAAATRTLPLARALTSRVGVLLVFPGVVLLVGTFLVLLGQRTLRESNLAMGRRQLAEQSRLVATHLFASLAQADPMLDELETFVSSIDSSSPVEQSAAVIHSILRGRTGVAHVSASFTEGLFQGAFIDTDGVVRFQQSRLENGATHVQRYEYASYGKLVSSADKRETDSRYYDPRTRDFYRRATAAGHRVWTQPYAFFERNYTGITRTMPVFRNGAAGPVLHAVLTIDFDVSELSKLIEASSLQSARTLLYTSDGTLLAFPEGRSRLEALTLRSDRPLSYHDLHDPTLEAFFHAEQSSPVVDGDLVRFAVESDEFFAMRAPVGPDRSIDWTIAYIVPESALFATLRRYSSQSVTIAGIAVLLALGIAVVFARLVVRVRRQVEAARGEARRAELHAQEFGSYRLIRCLGRGGMGEVWLAQHRCWRGRPPSR